MTNQKKNQKNNKYFCIFGGGGIRGITYVGAIKALQELNIEVDGCAGSSVGAVFASLYQFGFSLDEIKEIFFHTNFSIFKDINIDILKVFSITKGDHFLSWIREILEKKFYGKNYKEGKNPPITFKDLDKELIILSVNITDSTYKEFSKYTTPDTEIALAIRASVSIPGFFKPVEIDKDYYVDGDLIKSWPLWRLSKNLCPEDRRILEFRLEDEQTNRKITTGLSYINAVYNVITGFATDYIMDLYSMRDKFDYIRINSKNVAVLDFMIGESKREELINMGYEATRKYFVEDYPVKREKINACYEKILEFAICIQELIKKQKLEEAKCKTYELLAYLCEYKRFIDLVFYNSIINFKNLYLENIKENQVLFVKSKTLKNRNLIEASINKLINDLKINMQG